MDQAAKAPVQKEKSDFDRPSPARVGQSRRDGLLWCRLLGPEGLAVVPGGGTSEDVPRSPWLRDADLFFGCGGFPLARGRLRSQNENDVRNARSLYI